MNARSITDEAMEVLILQDWPGNVRQLENVVERCVVLSHGGAITPELVRNAMVRPAVVTKTDEPSASAPKDEGGMLHNLQEETILRVLAECGGNRTHAARKLGISTSTLWRRMKKMGY
jgi:DNA-binding NtrC family response regulator